MENKETEGKRDEKRYCFEKLPGNVRQIGEQGDNNRIYIEDYVFTYIHQVFEKKLEKAAVILLGKKGEGEAKGAKFVYGAVGIDVDIMEGNRAFTEETWDTIHDLVLENFVGAEVLGWGCGVSMWSNQVDENVKNIQQKYFSQEGKILFVEDVGEKEEKIFCWQNGKLREQAGYFIYYDKNPLMQDYMLRGQSKESFESAYQDKVTATVRKVVHKNEEEEKTTRPFAAYSAGIALVLLAIAGGNLLLQSTRKIDSLEKTIETLSNSAITTTGNPQAETGEKEKAEKDTPKDGKENGTKKKGSDKTKKKEPEETDKLKSIKSEEEPESSGKSSKESPKASVVVQKTEVPRQTEAAQKTKTPQKTESAQKTGIPQKTEEAQKKQESQQKPKQIKEPQKTEAPKVPKAKQKKVKLSVTPKKKVAVKRTAASYVVRAGDTLSQIVWRQYHTLSCIKMVKKANHIKNGDKIKEGQRLLLPAYNGK